MRLVRVAVNKALSYESARLVDILNSLWSNVVSVRQFEDLFLVVNDLKCSILKPLSYITSVKPTIFINNSSGEVGISVVTKEYI